MPPPGPPIMNEKTIKISPLMHNSMWSHSGMLTNYIVWAKEQLAELLLCFKSEGADSNRLSISLSVLFSETPNFEGAEASSSL